MTKYYVGFDYHKTVSQACVRDAEGEILAERRVGLKDASEGEAFIKLLHEWGGRRSIRGGISGLQPLVRSCGPWV